MTDDFATPLLDDNGKVRMRRFMVATLASAVVIAVGVALAMYTADPSGGWGPAIGIGAMIGFWMCPLAGAVIGNGFHESMDHKAHLEAEASTAPDAGSTNEPAAAAA